MRRQHDLRALSSVESLAYLSQQLHHFDQALGMNAVLGLLDQDPHGRRRVICEGDKEEEQAYARRRPICRNHQSALEDQIEAPRCWIWCCNDHALEPWDNFRYRGLQGLKPVAVAPQHV